MNTNKEQEALCRPVQPGGLRYNTFKSNNVKKSFRRSRDEKNHDTIIYLIID